MSAPTRPRRRIVRALAAIVLALAPALSLAANGPLPASAPMADAPDSPAPLPAFTLRLGLAEGAGGGGEGSGGSMRYRLRSPFEDPGFTARTAPAGKNTLLALGEVVLVNFVMWQGSYWMDKQYAKISTDTISQNFHKGWIIDTDGFWTNQFGHPLEGAFFYTAARSTGHGPYESFGISFLGSLFWESFMETQSPSVNDQVTTPAGGSVFGEVLYRMYRLVLDSSARPSGWRRFGAFAISPMTGANEFLFNDRYRGPTLLPPSWMGEFSFGMVVGGTATDLRSGARETEVGPWASLAAHITYGVPGDPHLRLREPFDHFDARFAYSFTGQVEPTASMLIRGVLVGDTLESAGGAPLGLWGLFTSYDVISVPLFKAAGFGLGPGVSLTRRWDWFELHGTALAEFLPWAGGGSVEKLYQRDYHYGPGAKAVLDLRALFGDRVILDLIGREYWISGAYATGSSEDITWTRAALTSRLVGPHAVSVSTDWARRHASYPGHPDVSERGATILAHYTLLQGW